MIGFKKSLVLMSVSKKSLYHKFKLKLTNSVPE